MDITLANHSLETAVFSSKDGNGSPHVEHAESDCQFSMMMGIELSNDICSYPNDTTWSLQKETPRRSLGDSPLDNRPDEPIVESGQEGAFTIDNLFFPDAKLVVDKSVLF